MGMNYQRSTNKRSGLRSVLVFMLVLAALVCCFAVSAFAEEVRVNPDELAFSADHETVIGGITYYTKVYDGTKAAYGVSFIGDTTPFADDPTVEIAIDKTELTSSDAGKCQLTVTFKLLNDTTGKYSAPAPVTVPAIVTPRELSWNADAEAEATVEYDRTASYEIGQIGDVTVAEFVEANLDLTNLLPDDELTVAEDLKIVLGGVTAPGAYTATLAPELGNYTVDALAVDVTVEKVGIKSVDFGKTEYAEGDERVFSIEATVTDNTGKKWIVPVSYLQKNAAGEWEEVAKISAARGEYKVFIKSIPDATDVEIPAWNADGAVTVATINVVQKVYKVGMDGATYVGDADLTTGENTTKFFVGVKGLEENLPTEILNLIQYFDEDGNPFTGATAYGETFVKAVLPSSTDYAFVNASGRRITSLSAIITINRPYLSSERVEETEDEEDKKAETEETTEVEEQAPVIDVIVYNNGNGFDPDAKVITKLPVLDRNVLRGFPVHSEFTVSFAGIDKDEVLTLYIPISESLYSKHVDALTLDDLYILDAEKNELVKASEKYTVTLLDGYYRVEGCTAAEEITFVTAPVYHTPFWITAPGIALIVMVVLAIVVLLFFLGVKSRKTRSSEENGVTVVDTIGERYEGKITLVEGAPAAPRVNPDSLTVEMPEEPEVEVEDDETLGERTRDAVVDSMQTLADEAMQIVLPREDLTPAENVTNALAAKLSDSLDQTVDPDHEDVHYDVADGELKDAVADAMRMAVNESADATDAVAVVVEAPKAVDADDEDDDEDDDALGFSTAGLTFIDVESEPETYQEMLAQERAGEIKIVYRYRRSFASRLAQSQGNVQDYYSAIKNLLLSYKGVKGRTSWNYEAFNRGRAQVAKINAKTKTLYLYLALNPEELTDSKYGIVDMSSKKKYAAVPVLMKIKGERKFKYALELIEKLCGEDLALAPVAGYEDTDFRTPYKTTEELVAEGAMKMFAAAIPMSEVTEA